MFYKNMKTFTEGKTVDTTNIQPGEPIHTDSDLYNVNTIREFNYMIAVVCTKNIMISIFPTAPKRSPV